MARTKKYHKKKRHTKNHRRNKKLTRKVKRHGGGCNCGGGRLKGGGTPGGGGWNSGRSNPNVGYPWAGGDVKTWPGVSGTLKGATVANHFPVSKYGVPAGGFDPPMLSNPGLLPGEGVPRGGGKRKKTRKHKRKQKGGGLIPQQLINLGRDIGYQAHSFFNDFRGTTAPVNPSPTVQPNINKDYKYIGGFPPNVPAIYDKSGKQVAAI